MPTGDYSPIGYVLSNIRQQVNETIRSYIDEPITTSNTYTIEYTDGTTTQYTPVNANMNSYIQYAYQVSPISTGPAPTTSDEEPVVRYDISKEVEMKAAPVQVYYNQTNNSFYTQSPEQLHFNLHNP